MVLKLADTELVLWSCLLSSLELGFPFLMVADWFLICCQISRIHNLIIGSPINYFQIVSIENFLVLTKIFARAFIWKIVLTLLLLVVCSAAYFWCYCSWGCLVAQGLSWEVWSSLCFHVWSKLARPLESTSWLSLPIACRNTNSGCR
jgi:hypothetical protein